MTDSLILIEVNKKLEGSTFEKPLLRQMEHEVPSLVTFDFDTFSEENIRQYALDLTKQSRKTAVVVQVNSEEGPHTGLISFFNRLQQQKHPYLMLLKQGPLPAQLEKMMRVIGGARYHDIQSMEEAEKQLLPFFDQP